MGRTPNVMRRPWKMSTRINGSKPQDEMKSAYENHTYELVKLPYVSSNFFLVVLFVFVLCPDSVSCFLFLFQIYEWINDSERLYLSPGGVSVRLDLISKAHGLEAAEKYFTSIPDKLRASCVYGALLNCYADAKSLRKAEGTMQKMKNLGDANVLKYNIMMNLYVQMGDLEKLHSLVQEMEDKRISGNAFTYAIRLNAYASVPIIKEMEKLLMKVEEDPLLIE
ncbi:pentatricopeptide repeat-containing protein At2g20710, mitochondrial-like [Lycium ferocissimum]|uniref:pentatricopeptide repeat-containing protein At2g20710, mitochondrial-like n=1 Tax=Lycium ferocissimum TaxID=112874 RepID=UPI00281579C8|nr:pentatricopeptide repeat-containing protein At2g20710, mitochondrial-like [Lycium ferocissimum]